ncbi:MAG TPA: hypothetical protein VIN40_02015 [Candidatus Tyrphobacter sp.]
MDPSKRFAALVLALGTVVLLLAIAVGQRMGYRLLGQSTELTPAVLPTVLITPEPADANGGVYGPDWRRSQTLSGAPDPGFPDPRVPPAPLPTRPPAPPPPSPERATPTRNPNIPIWRQSPIPTESPVPASPRAAATGAAPSPGATAHPPW